MASLPEILEHYPILETFTRVLPLGGLINLSRTCTSVRAILHKFDATPTTAGARIPGSDVRTGIELGLHDTPSWRYLKSLCTNECSEPAHLRGKNAKGCRMCSLPVCEACIVRDSWGKKEDSFSTRRRHLCYQCWLTGTTSADHLRYVGDTTVVVNYGDGTLCVCTGKEGVLCSRCKEQQLGVAKKQTGKCAGYGCKRDVEERSLSRRICLWCQHALPGERTSQDRRSNYEKRCRTASQNDFPYFAAAVLNDDDDQFLTFRNTPLPTADTSTMPPLKRRMTFDEQRWTPSERPPGFSQAEGLSDWAFIASSSSIERSYDTVSTAVGNDDSDPEEDDASTIVGPEGWTDAAAEYDEQGNPNEQDGEMAKADMGNRLK